MSQGGGGGVQRNRVFSRLSQISPRPNMVLDKNDSTELAARSKLETLAQRWFTVDPPSTSLTQQ